jgi:hypothetical protein
MATIHSIATSRQNIHADITTLIEFLRHRLANLLVSIDTYRLKLVRHFLIPNDDVYTQGRHATLTLPYCAQGEHYHELLLCHAFE